jgi:hypothetical protein
MTVADRIEQETQEGEDRAGKMKVVNVEAAYMSPKQRMQTINIGMLLRGWIEGRKGREG